MHATTLAYELHGHVQSEYALDIPEKIALETNKAFCFVEDHHKYNGVPIDDGLKPDQRRRILQDVARYLDNNFEFRIVVVEK